MNKYAEVFAKQNPTWEHKCENCNHKNKLKTKEVLSAKGDFVFICSKCGVEVTIKDIPTFVNDLEKKLKKMGITVK